MTNKQTKNRWDINLVTVHDYLLYNTSTQRNKPTSQLKPFVGLPFNVNVLYLTCQFYLQCNIVRLSIMLIPHTYWHWCSWGVGCSCSCSWDLIPSLENSICHRCQRKKKMVRVHTFDSLSNHRKHFLKKLILYCHRQKHFYFIYGSPLRQLQLLLPLYN